MGLGIWGYGCRLAPGIAEYGCDLVSGIVEMAQVMFERDVSRPRRLAAMTATTIPLNPDPGHSWGETYHAVVSALLDDRVLLHVASADVLHRLHCAPAQRLQAATRAQMIAAELQSLPPE